MPKRTNRFPHRQRGTIPPTLMFVLATVGITATATVGIVKAWDEWIRKPRDRAEISKLQQDLQVEKSGRAQDVARLEKTLEIEREKVIASRPAAELEAENAELKSRLVVLEKQLKTRPTGATAHVQAVASLLQELSVEQVVQNPETVSRNLGLFPPRYKEALGREFEKLMRANSEFAGLAKELERHRSGEALFNTSPLADLEREAKRAELLRESSWTEFRQLLWDFVKKAPKVR